MAVTSDSLPDDPSALKAIILAQRDEISRLTATEKAFDALVQSLKIRIARLQKQKFGPSSEKIEREIEQLQLALENLEVAAAAADRSAAPEPDAPEEPAAPVRRQRGKPRIGDDTSRERHVLDPGTACPDCGGPLRLLGEDVSAVLDFVAARLKLVETARLKKSCRHCERIVQPPAPTRPIRRGMAGPNLLAHILVSKFDDHVPLYRQREILARHGADIPRSTLIDWCGQAAATLRPLSERIRREVMKTDRLHADDTPIKVLDPARRQSGGARGVKEGRIWVYVREDRPWAGSDPPGAAYWFSPNRKGEHPRSHLAGFAGILQADAYAGFKELYRPGGDGTVRIREAACWAHLRRDFHDVWKSTGSPIAREALDRIGALYDIEREIKGRSADERLAVRQRESLPRAQAFRCWCDEQLARISGKSDLAKAMRYALNRWASFTLFLEDGRVAIDNNPAERALRPIALGRKNFLFAGSDAGGEIVADAMTLIETAKLSGLNPQDYLADVLARINDHLVSRLDELLPWNWTQSIEQAKAAA